MSPGGGDLSTDELAAFAVTGAAHRARRMGVSAGPIISCCPQTAVK